MRLCLLWVQIFIIGIVCNVSTFEPQVGLGFHVEHKSITGRGLFEIPNKFPVSDENTR